MTRKQGRTGGRKERQRKTATETFGLRFNGTFPITAAVAVAVAAAAAGAR